MGAKRFIVYAIVFVLVCDGLAVFAVRSTIAVPVAALLGSALLIFDLIWWSDDDSEQRRAELREALDNTRWRRR